MTDGKTSDIKGASPRTSPATFYWQLAIFLVGFLLVVGLSHIYSRVADELGVRTALERSRLFIGEEIVDSIQEIEKGVYQMVATSGVPAQQRISRIISARIAKLEKDIAVLQHGGTVQRVSPLNMEGRDEAVRSVSYTPDASQGYLMEVIELGPHVDIMRTTLARLGEMLERRESIRERLDTAALLSYEQEINLFLKSVPPLFFRVNENANRMFVESSAKLQQLEHLVEIERRKHKLLANSAIFLVIVSVMVSGFLFFRQVATSGLALGAALENMRSARDDAQQANRAKTQFLANMSHEIRTPMNAVLGLTELLLKTNLDGKQQKFAETISRAGSSLLSILNDILDLSRIEAGKLNLEQADFDLHHLVDDIVFLFRPTAETKGIFLSLALDPATPRFVRGDQLRLRQTLVNIVGNAIKFTEQGTVTLDVAREPEAQETGRDPELSVRFTVRDTGIGIDPEKRAHIFNTFAQADESMTRRYGGTGLGLSLSRQFIEMMGGRLEVESMPEKGSIFFFTIPFSAPQSNPYGIEDAQPSAEPEPAVEVRTSPARPRILLAEDNVDNVAVAIEMLQILGYDVDTASSGTETVAAASACSYDLIFMDCNMPELDGYGATLQIRLVEMEQGKRRTPIVALTGFAMAEDRKACLETGMDDHLSKPFTLRQMREMCTKWIQPAAER